MKLLEMFPAQDEHKEESEIDWVDDLKFFMDNDHHMLSSYLFPAIKRHEKHKDNPKAWKIYIKPISICFKHYCNKFKIKDAEKKFNKESLIKLAKQIAEEQKKHIDDGDYDSEDLKYKVDESRLIDSQIDEGWKQNLAALGVAGAMGLSSMAGAADKVEPVDNKIVATLNIAGETKILDLSPKNFKDVKEATKWLEKFLDDRGIDNWSGKIERGVKGSGNYERMKIDNVGANLGMHGRNESMDETIRKVKGGYRLYSKNSEKNLGTYPTKAGAVKRERQVQYFKHKG
jgi:hypothetical protein